MNLDVYIALAVGLVLLIIGGLVGAASMYAWLLKQSEDPAHPEDWYL